MIKLIVFDLAEVLLGGLIGVEEIIEKKEGIDKRAIYNAVVGGDEWDLFYKGKITEDEFWKRILEKNKWDVDINFLKKAVRSNFKEVEGTRDIVLKLKDKYTICLLSVHGREWIDYCNEKYGLDKLFPHRVYSFDVGLCKKDEKIFRLVLNKFNVKPEETLYIDDWPQYINTAKRLGINTILFKNAEQLKRDLKDYGITIS